jgi:hypothetical protein
LHKAGSNALNSAARFLSHHFEKQVFFIANCINSALFFLLFFQKASSLFTM